MAANKHGLETEVPKGKRQRLDEGTGFQPVELTQRDQEIAVGITVYISPEKPGFDCTVKQRYTDFLVNEILPNGKVLHLESLPQSKSDRRPKEHIAGKNAEVAKPDENGAPAQKSAEAHAGIESSKDEDSAKDMSNDQAIVPELSAEDVVTLHDIFDEGTSDQIVKLYAAVLSHPHRKPRDHPTVKSAVIAEKSRRTQAHLAVRQIFNSKLETATLQDQLGVISIKAAATKTASNVRGQANGSSASVNIPKGKLGWEELGGEYLHFTLHKENKDTMEVLFFMGSQLKIHIKNFQFAGTKDRRGVTVQRVALFRVHAQRVAGLNRLAKGWVASDFEYKKHGLELGELMGNQFLLTLRDVHLSGEGDCDAQQRFDRTKAAVFAATESFRKSGFMNYYGLQRFGSFSTGTHVVGMRILKGDLQGAIDAILAYSSDLLPENQPPDANVKAPQEDITRATTIKHWRETGEASSAMPRRFQAEAAIMQYLSKRDRKTKQLIQDKDWQGALMQIQRNLRLIYVHAYQSLVWNTVAGKRWELYGARTVEGDLVIVGEKDDIGKAVKDEFDEDGEPVFHPAPDDSAAADPDQYTRARPLSREEAEGEKYDIFDVVLPLPGFDVIYPANEIGKFYEEFMASESGGQLDPHNMRRAWKDISLSGGYRKMMSRPGSGFECEVKEYESETEQLVETDVEKLRKAMSTADVAEGPEEDAEHAENHRAGFTKDEEGQVSELKEKKTGVVLKFQLGSSQYATMALRELTKGGAVTFKPDFSAPR